MAWFECNGGGNGSAVSDIMPISWAGEVHNIQGFRTISIDGNILSSPISNRQNCVGILSVPVTMPSGADGILIKYKLQAVSYTDITYYSTMFCTDTADTTLTDKTGAYGNRPLIQKVLDFGEAGYFYDAIEAPSNSFYLNIQFGVSNYKSIEAFAFKINN